MSFFDTSVSAQEPVVNGQSTDNVCKKISNTAFEIDGKSIQLPVKVNSASMLMLMFVVDADKVAALIDGTGYRPLKIWPGKALLQLLAVDYRENDLGDYNEGAIIFPVITPKQKIFPYLGAWKALIKGSACNFVYRMPVNQDFTTHAGRFIWGFPKWNADVKVHINHQQAMASFSDGHQLVYQIEAATGSAMSMKEQSSPSVTVRNNRACKTYGVSSAEGVTMKLGGKIPAIGESHPLAIELRKLGLPKKPIVSISAQDLKMSFGAGEEVPIGEAFSS